MSQAWRVLRFSTQTDSREEEELLRHRCGHRSLSGLTELKGGGGEVAGRREKRVKPDPGPCVLGCGTRAFSQGPQGARQGV